MSDEDEAVTGHGDADQGRTAPGVNTQADSATGQDPTDTDHPTGTAQAERNAEDEPPG
jgi:hypothetical protein